VAAILQTRGLAKQYGKLWALHGLDLDVEKGEVFGFLGPNGAGKTTFTKCVTGFVRPDKGEIRIVGLDARRQSTQVARHIGLVPDQYDFYPNLSGRQHLDFYARLQGMDKRSRRARIDEVLVLVRMEERADDRTKAYSHGMKQRICIGQALLHEPDLIFFDEPTNGLDPKGAYELREMIRGLSRDGTTVFLNSHLLHEVEQVCQRVAILNKGKLLALSRVADLQRNLGAGGALEVEVRLESGLKKHQTAAARVTGGAVVLDGPSLRFSADEALIPDVVAALVAAGARIQAVTPHGASLESVFLQLTDDEGAPQ
jgi:ABC-2 type transport system ATP-binding protein